MHLKLLELKGFKSFADNTEIEFQPGLNIIVGPNGCGKSNIVDAIRWVLGESNVRNLRGQRSEDVIFTGTDKKKPLGFASVSMNIDNQDQALSTDFTEITVTRKVYRTGESEFYINKNEVRLKDIHSLFSGTGLGRKGYSIIGQGELEQILNAKPFDRRLILEEAAGLTKYRQKKEEAEAKLQSTAHDMVRVKDIIVELDSRVGDLKERAARAKKYLEVSGELGGLERRVMAYDIFLHRQEVQARMAEMAEFEQQIASVKQEVEKLETQYNGVQNYIEDLQKESSDLKDKKYVLGTEIGRQESDRKLAEERIKNASERLVQLREDIVKYTDMLTSLEDDLVKSRGNLAVKQTELEAKMIEANELTTEIETARSDLADREKIIESLKGDLIEHLNYESNIKNKSLEKEEKVRKNQDKLGRGQNEINYRQEKLVVLEENLAVLDRDHNLEQKALDGLAAEKEQCEQEKSAAAARRIELEKQIAELEKATRLLKNNLLTLDEAMKSHIGFSEGVRKLLDANGEATKIPGLVGVITDLMEVPTGLEQAVEAAVGRGLENIVVKTDRDAQQAIDLLKARTWGRVTFLPLNMLRPLPVDKQQLAEIKKIPGVLGLGSELVKFHSEYRLAVEHLLGRVLVVEDLDVGLKVFRKYPYFKIVSREGDIINASGAMTGGKTQSRGPTPLKIKSEHREQSKTYEMKTNQLQENMSQLETSKEQARSLEERMRELTQGINERTFRQEILKKEVERTKLEQKQMNDEIELLQAEEKLGQREIETLHKEIAELQNEFEDIKNRSQQANEQLDVGKSELDRLSRRCEILAERYTHCADLVSVKEKELEGQRRSVEQLESVQASYSSSLEDCETQITRLQSIVENEGTRGRELLHTKVESEREMERVDGLLRVLDKKLATAAGQAAELRDHLSPLKEQGAVLEERLRNLELRKVRAETEEKNALLNWEERFSNEEYEAAWEGMDMRQQREMRKRTEHLKQAVEDLGIVDLGSIAELEEVHKRHEFLETQLQDLIDAKESLNRLIDETESQMNFRFREFLAKANEGFKYTFTSIFRGGEAELLQENEENPWQAGVEILVKMPGKRRQPLNLLSGGERALTCIAFIFALLMLKPVPFCLLDEIDAALDEVNLMRFTDFLRKLCETMQFIVITHRQATIESGETIYGVTMPEQGISDVLSVSVKEAESLAG